LWKSKNVNLPNNQFEWELKALLAHCFFNLIVLIILWKEILVLELYLEVLKLKTWLWSENIWGCLMILAFHVEFYWRFATFFSQYGDYLC